MQITEVFECHNKTVTRQTSSQGKSRRLSGKLHCLNFVFHAENETPGPVCLGCEASSSSVSLSMLKVPICVYGTKRKTLSLEQCLNLLPCQHTLLLLFGTGPRLALSTSFSVAIDGKALNRASQYKYLGVIIDASLTWNVHAEYLVGKVGKRLAILGRIRKNVNMYTQVPFIRLLFSLFLITAIQRGAAVGMLTLISGRS